MARWRSGQRVQLLVGLALSGILGTFMVQGQALQNPADDEVRLRWFNLLLLLFHFPWLGWALISSTLSSIRYRTSWLRAMLMAILLLAMLVLGLSAGFGWLGFDHEENLQLATAISSLIAFFEFLSLVVWRTQRIQYYSSRGNYNVALRLIEPRLRRAQVSFYDQIAAGIFHLRLGHAEEGERLVAEGLDNSKRDPVALTHVANARYIQERYAEGLALTDEVIAAIGVQPLLLLNRCVFLVALNRVAEAREMWFQVKQLQDPNALVPKNDRDGQLVLARVKAALGETEAAIAALS